MRFESKIAKYYITYSTYQGRNNLYLGLGMCDVMLGEPAGA